MMTKVVIHETETPKQAKRVYVGDFVLIEYDTGLIELYQYVGGIDEEYFIVNVETGNCIPCKNILFDNSFINDRPDMRIIKKLEQIDISYEV